jgi:hypothetical protein
LLKSYGDDERLHIEVRVYPSDHLEISELVLDQLWLREQGLERYFSWPQNKPQHPVFDDSASKRTIWSFSVSDRQLLRHKELNLKDLLHGLSIKNCVGSNSAAPGAAAKIQGSNSAQFNGHFSVELQTFVGAGHQPL